MLMHGLTSDGVVRNLATAELWNWDRADIVPGTTFLDIVTRKATIVFKSILAFFILSGITAMLVVFDEVHQIYSKKTHYANAMVAMRKKYPEIDRAVMGISSTPELDTVSARKNAMTLFGGNKLPEYAMYPPDEFESLKVKMQTLPAKPHANDFKVIDLPTPVGDKEYREEMKLLHQSIINLMMAHPDEKKIAHNAMRDQLNTIMAMQLHDTDGGLFIKEVCKKRDEPRLIKVDNDMPETEPKESVLICYKYDKAARKHMTMLNELIDKKEADTPPLCVIDLGVEIPAEHKETLSDACKAMSASFNLQSYTTVGFAGWKNTTVTTISPKLAASSLPSATTGRPLSSTSGARAPAAPLPSSHRMRSYQPRTKPSSSTRPGPSASTRLTTRSARVR